ncbi:MAG: YoaK family protein [Marinobacter sp.]|uniref:YoaK family protein n=1 Tax=Marinobacter sp. TaxID=50741 RepID=UPI00299F1819|nr:YoaK family protein [Marinobacter sp.]MDX1757744.1 YoaK family protein [Marinobacter sp.]
MIRKLPRWVEIGGFWLALVAGAVNAIGLLGFEHQAVSHLTGTSSLIALSLVNLVIPVALHLLLIMLFFVAGAMLSGAWIGNVALKMGRRYSVALCIEAGLLLAAMVVLGRGSNAGHYLASAACGLQNGMVSTYSGAIVRTTHMSGLFTDLGTMLGARLRGSRLDRRRVLLYCLLILGFIAGGCVGALAFHYYHFNALALPAAGTLLLAAVYWMFRLGRGPARPAR